VNRALVFGLIAAASLFAQAPGPDARRPSLESLGLGRPDAQSPEVSSDRRVTFRLRAPNAKQVLVTGITQQPIPMQKSGEGIWSATTEPLKPDLYEYAFVVDGLRIVDPANTRFRPAYGRCELSV
jgi:1,4-alpha-glucan branching enzyme